MSIERKRKYWIGGVSAAVVIGVAAWAALSRCRIEGDTPADRIDSICRLAGEKPWGAGAAIAQAAGKDSDVSVRRAALVALAGFPKDEYRPMIEQSLGEPDPGIRAAAAGALGAYGDVEAANRLGAMVLDRPDSDPAVRIGAIQGLGLNTSPNALAWLIRIVEREPAPAVHRRALIEAYAKLGAHYYGAESSSGTEAQRLGAAEYLKRSPAVKEAYRIAAWPLDRRPEFDLPTQHEVKNHADNK